MSEIQFVDTTLRDGQMSLWASHMTTDMMLPVAAAIDNAGFIGAEIIGTAIITKIVRELHDDPWERIRVMAQRMPNTPLRFIRTRYMAAFNITPLALFDLFHERAAAHGMRGVRASDPTNTVSSWQQYVRSARRAGLECIVNVIYSVSPKHTDLYYAEKARAAAELGSDRICLKDPGGLLTPERTRTLAPLFVQNAGGVPAELHSHCNAGLGPLVALEAMKAGFTIINTAIPPLANGSSLPSINNVAANARTLGHTPLIDEDLLRPVTEHFTFHGRRKGYPMGVPAEYDEFHFQHQVPGGMVSNLGFQLSQLGAGNRLREVLEECVRVRADLGYPIMVTPYSQFVGAQAALNVMLGERYKQVTDQVIQYALGYWGAEEAEGVDPAVRDRILGRARARELGQEQPPEPTMAEVREQLGGAGVNDDDLLLRYFAGTAEAEALKARQPGGAPVDATRPLSALLGELAGRRGIGHIQIEKGGFVFQMDRPSSASVPVPAAR